MIHIINVQKVNAEFPTLKPLPLIEYHIISIWWIGLRDRKKPEIKQWDQIDYNANPESSHHMSDSMKQIYAEAFRLFGFLWFFNRMTEITDQSSRQ